MSFGKRRTGDSAFQAKIKFVKSRAEMLTGVRTSQRNVDPVKRIGFKKTG